MDGAREQTIVNTGLIWPNGLTIDREAQILYWADASLDKIESSNVDGTNRRIILQDGIHHPFSIVFFNSTLYWSDWEVDRIYSSKLIGSRSLGLSTLGQELSTEPMAVQVISTQIQVNGKKMHFTLILCINIIFLWGLKLKFTWFRIYHSLSLSPSLKGFSNKIMHLLLFPVTNPCAVDNGNCSHLCLLSVEGEAGFSCACPNGYQMLPGNTQQCVGESVSAELKLVENCRVLHNW